MVIGIGLQRKGRDMSKLNYLIDGKADEQFEKMLWCFGGGDNNDDSGGGSDDYDEDDFVDNSGNIRQEFQDGGAGQRAVEANIERNRAQNRDQRDQVSGMQQQQATEQAISNVTQALFPTQPNEVQIAAAAAMTPAQRAAASAANDAMFNDFIANDIMNQRMDAAMNPQVQVFDMNDPAGDYMLNPSLARGNPADISVGAPNLPPRFITDASGTTFDTITGEIVDSTSDASYFGDLGGTSGSTASGLTAGQQAAADRLTGMARTPSGQAASNYMGNITDAIGDQSRFVNRRFRDAANAGAILRPNFNASGQLDGFAANTGPFGSFVYTGMNNPNAPADTSDSDDVVPPQTNPLTGAQQCPDGYIFDDFLQACRPKTRSEKNQNTGGSTGNDSGAFFRRTSLDDAPANLPAGFDFDAANRRFTESYGYRPDFYRSPMSLTGFTRVS